MNARSIIGSMPIVAGALMLAGLLQLSRTEAQPPPPAGGLGFSGTILPGLGLRVNFVFPFSPAQRVGLEPGDVILMVNGVRIDGMATYQGVLSGSGGWVDLVIRDVRTGAMLVLPRVPLEPPAFVGSRPVGPPSTPAAPNRPRSQGRVYRQSR